uniref:Variant surface glycoprotein 1692 n=1 Tax=Trypanosoma brucei TaxID=5691 RepID=M4SZ24_9TRYP|nr:variant surface glycoprotein 1692 [Trypanosoma brucei]
MFHCITTAVIIVTAACVCYNQYAQADEANAKNVADLELLCHVINLHTDDASEFDDTDLPTQEQTELEKINMSISLPMWQAMFPKESTPDDKDPDYCKKAVPKDTCISQWNKWKKTAVAAAKADNLPTKALIPTAKLASAAGLAARLHIKALLEEATHLVNDYNTRVKPLIRATKTLSQGELQNAIFGEGAQPTESNNRCKAQLKSNRQTACKVTGAAKTVCGTAVCICAKDGTQTGTHLCSTATSGTNLAYDSSSNEGQVYEPIHTRCAHAEQPKLTEAHIRNLVTTFRAKLKTKGNNPNALVYYGTQTTNKRLPKYGKRGLC